MTSRAGPEEHADAIGAQARHLAGMIRRMAISLTSRSFWQLVGHRLLDGTTETREAEVFSGIGFYARPPAGSKPEAIVAFPNGGAQPIIIATRDEQTRKAALGAGEDDATYVHNSEHVVAVTSDGIAAKSVGGTAHELALLSDVQAVANAALGAVDFAAFKAALLATAGWPVGTSVLKGE